MSTTTMNLPCVRFVKRVNNGTLGSKYSYIAMMADNAKALESAEWHESAVPIQNVTMPVNKVSETDAKYDENGAMISPPSFSAFMSDGFDCYQQGGDARKEDGTMCGYAGCVAYRFKIPDSAASVALDSVTLAIQRDRYCRAGVRVALELSNSATPSNDWSVVRGEGSGAIVSPSTASTSLGVSSWGFLSQSNVQNLVSGRAADSLLTFNASGDDSFPGLATTGKTYLWVYLTLEDYTSYWTMYNAKEARYYSIEGSAVLLSTRALFRFAGTVTKDSSGSWILGPYGASGELRNYEADAQAAEPLEIGPAFSCGGKSGFFLTSNTNDIINVLKNPDLLRTKPSFSRAVGGNYSSLASSSVPLDDCDVIGGLPNDVDTDSIAIFFYNKKRTGTNGNGELIAPTFGVIKSMAVVVPTDKAEYSEVAINSNLEATRFGENGPRHLECDLLFWKSSSLAFFGPWREVALTALASNGAFFTGKKQTITGSVKGDGNATSSVTVTAEATLIKRISVPEEASSISLNFELAQPLRQSEVVIVVPAIRKISNLTFFRTELTNAAWASGTSAAISFR